MRIWSVHPGYLDTQGLTALWRETLLAKKVLEGKTKGYRNHPQLNRFKKSDDPLRCISQYLAAVYGESLKRGYHFNKEKFHAHTQLVTLPVTRGQIDYETQHLLKKLQARDVERYTRLLKETTIALHPLFYLIDGETEEWEIV
ncbi:MAG: hypothetical protein IH596_12840 [Bacteroidales bacterium]|nr:hypothetical protein [Bacteroidales bacterium]